MNQKGGTLIEVLAALMISSIVIGVIFATFMSINQEWNQTTNKAADDNEVRKALNVLNHYLSDAISVQVDKSQNQFHITLGSGQVVTITFENNNLTLVNAGRSTIVASNIVAFPTFTDASNSELIGLISDGALFTITIPFYYQNVAISGQSLTPTIKTIPLKVKLLNTFSEP